MTFFLHISQLLLDDNNVKMTNCVVPENIQIPTTEGISLRTPPPPWIFHFCRELMTPHPPGISNSLRGGDLDIFWNHTFHICRGWEHKTTTFSFFS